MEKAMAVTSPSTVDGLAFYPPEPMAASGECPGGTYWYHSRLECALKVIDYLAKAPWAAFDFETGGVDPWTSPLYLLSVSVKAGEAHVFDLRSLRRHEQFNVRLAELLGRGKWMAHNSSFDQAFVMAQLGVKADIQYDTLVASQILTAGLTTGNSLDDLFERHLGVTLEKSWQKLFATLHPASPIPNEAIAYSAGDVALLFPLAGKLQEALKEAGLVHIWETIEKPFLPIVASARHHGIHIDVPRLEAIKAELETAVAGHLDRFHDIVGWHTYVKGKLKPKTVTEPAVSISSWQQLMEYYAGWGIFLESTDSEHLNEILERKRLKGEIRDATEAILAYRADSKILGTYAIPLSSTHLKAGKLHPNWKQAATATGRMSCAEPNVQNIPSKGPWAKIRETFVAQPGHKLVIADYSQMELRVAAELSGEPLFVEAIKNGVDLHKQTACIIFQTDDITKEQRSVAKTINFGIVYGAGAQTVASQCGIGVEEAELLLARFFARYQTLAAYLKRSGQHAKDFLCSETPAGRKRYYDRPDPTDRQLYRKRMSGIAREGCNAPIQGANADATKLASIMFEGAKAPGAQILMWVHDEIVVTAPEAIVEATAELLKQCMITAAATWIKSVPIDVSVTVSERWEK